MPCVQVMYELLLSEISRSALRGMPSLHKANETSGEGGNLLTTVMDQRLKSPD